jgi:hypothetical protein
LCFYLLMIAGMRDLLEVSERDAEVKKGVRRSTERKNRRTTDQQVAVPNLEIEQRDNEQTSNGDATLFTIVHKKATIFE